MNEKRYQEVLGQLDEQADSVNMNFPAFGMSFYYIDSRMSVYANEEYWGMLIESIEVNPHAYGHAQLLNCVSRFGNNLIHRPGLRDDDFHRITSDGTDGHVFGDPESRGPDCLRPNVKTIRLQNHLVEVPHEPDFYETKGIRLLNPSKISQHELLRALTPEYREHFFLSEVEKQGPFKSPVPLLLQLEQWHHPTIDEESIQEQPSKLETFQVIARVIATCDPGEYQPTEKPNTHWQNWLISDEYL